MDNNIFKITGILYTSASEMGFRDASQGFHEAFRNLKRNLKEKKT